MSLISLGWKFLSSSMKKFQIKPLCFIPKILKWNTEWRAPTAHQQCILVDVIYGWPLAILELEEDVQLTDDIQPICLPGQVKRNLEGVKATAVGFGYVNDKEEEPEQLMQALVPILSNKQCKQNFITSGLKNISDKIYETNLCAGGQGEEGVCNGGKHLWCQIWGWASKWP